MRLPKTHPSQKSPVSSTCMLIPSVPAPFTCDARLDGQDVNAKAEGFLKPLQCQLLPALLGPQCTCPCHMCLSSNRLLPQATLTVVYPCFFLSCTATARVKLAKTLHGPHSFKLVVICVVLSLFVLFYVLFVCKCVLYYCQRVTSQLHLTNISCDANSTVFTRH